MTSAYAAEEARLNLTEEDQRLRLAKLLEKVRMIGAIALLPPGVELPERDQPILQAALHARATHLLTGDKQHFGPHFGRRLGGVLVLPPTGYFERRRKGKACRTEVACENRPSANKGQHLQKAVLSNAVGPRISR